MGAILHTIFSNRFYCMEVVVFWLEFHWSLFPWIQLTINNPALVQVFQQATSDNLKQRWQSVLAHICVTRPQWVIMAAASYACCIYTPVRVESAWMLLMAWRRLVARASAAIMTTLDAVWCISGVLQRNGILWDMVYNLVGNSVRPMGQWETTLQCNVVSHWLSPYP